MKSLLNIWSSKNLTLLGKITVIKSMVIPKIVYKASHLPAVLPDTLIKQVNQILFKFIWGAKWEKIGRSQLWCNIDEEGGLKWLILSNIYLLYNLKVWLNYIS